MTQLEHLHETIAAVCPIVGVSSYEDTDDQGQTTRHTRIDFRDAATAQQRANAQTVADSFDWSDAAHQQWLADREPEKRDLAAAAAQAIADNDTFLAIASPNTAQAIAQVRRLTQQNTRIIRRLMKVD